ncbi:acetyl-CoA synthetase-like protein [Trametes punicea]|nr:acetyl-CoA synthetase-like protein [Trametes punicea]
MSESPFAYLPVPENPDADYKRQCVAVPDTKRPGQTPHYRQSAYPFVTLETPNTFKNLLQVFDEGYRRAKNNPCLGHRPIVSTQPLKYADYYVWQSWPEIDARRRAIGSGLHKLFQTGEIGGGDLPTVGIWSKNCPNWQLVDLALQAYAKVGVSLYDTLGKDSAVFIINHAELTVVFANPTHIPALLKLAPKTPTLRMVIAMEPLSPETKAVLSAWGETVNIKIMELAELEEFGRANLIDVIQPTTDQIATICYTSGTTGDPKGVVITQGAMAQAIHSYLYMLTLSIETTMLSFLPLAHVYERIMELLCLAVGGRVGYASNDPLMLLEDIQLLRPHFMPSVPRVWNRIYQAAMSAGSAPGLKGALFRTAVATKLNNLRTKGEFHHALWDRLVFKKHRHFWLCPISPNVMDFMKIALGVIVIEGTLSAGFGVEVLVFTFYGMTENCAAFSRTWNFDPTSSGTVGPPLPTSEFKLIDVPSMGYSADDQPYPRGEICMRGSPRFTCYYKDPKKTEETIDEEGWLHTGDVGMLDDCLRLKIIDRVKNIMKLAQGEYVALENIESVYSGSPLVSQVFVHGDPLQPYLVAVVVPDPVQFALLVSRVKGKPVAANDIATLTEATKDPQVVTAVLAELTKPAKEQGLKGFEQVRRVHLTLEALTAENGCLTPTLKIRRKETYEYFKKALEGLYALGEPAKL